MRRRTGSRTFGQAVVVLAALALVGCQHGAADDRAAGAPDAAAGTERDRIEDTMRIEELIQRRAPNVLIGRSGGNLRIRIRGQGTLSTPDDALVVIDGVAQDSPNSLLAVNPSDVDRVQVLTDAAAAMYGVRGANGVLVITTRRAR